VWRPSLVILAKVGGFPYNRAYMTLTKLKQQLADIITSVYGSQGEGFDFDVAYAAEAKFGDFACNAAMKLAGPLGRKPREIAESLVEPITTALREVERVEIAGPGFINLTFKDTAVSKLAMSAATTKPDTYSGQTVVTEYSDPNPFKVLHVGHLYTGLVGDAITNLVAAAGGKVHPVNFGGDVGLHVGKSMWAILRDLDGEQPQQLSNIAADDRPTWMAQCYVRGTQAYETDEAVKAEIITLNKRVYELHTSNDHSSPFAQIYWTCRQWSYDYFDQFYARIGSRFERYYPESETAPLGVSTVREQLAKGVYELSDEAVVFRGESHGLHTRVFINSNGLPTYEAKDVGLIMTKWRDYHFDRSIIITGNDILEYMKVVLKSIEQFAPELVSRSLHIVHGNVKLAGGVKMSSRKGNFLGAVDVLEMVAEAGRKLGGAEDDRVTIGAIRYAFLKQRIGSDIVFVPEDSVSLEGNSGPYLQYAYARANSILRKTDQAPAGDIKTLQAGERRLARRLMEYPDVIDRAVTELMPHHIATYLYELAQDFNQFYEGNRVIGDERETVRLRLVKEYANVLRDGLKLLGIEAPEQL
jgi:arginyl-tRNA synthetase